jgi:hypothetical protein
MQPRARSCRPTWSGWAGPAAVANCATDGQPAGGVNRPPCPRRGRRVSQADVVFSPGGPFGDGALGFRAALREVFPQTRERRCWFHYADLWVMPVWSRDSLRGGEFVFARSA